MTWLRSLLAIALLAIALIPIAGCGHQQTTSAVGRLLDPALATPFASVAGATRSMSRDLAAQATTIPAPAARRFLATHGYQGGYSRVWRSGQEFISVLGYEFFDHADATGWQRLAFDNLATSKAYAGFTDPGLQNAQGYLLTSDVAGATKFCAGEWFTDDRFAFVVTHCAPFPLSPGDVMQLAQRQSRFDVRAKR